MPAPIDQLVSEARQGDSAAWGALAEELKPLICRHARRILHRYGFADFASAHMGDITSAILLDLFENLHKCERHFMPWFIVRIRYRVVDYVRANKAHIHVLPPHGEEEHSGQDHDLAGAVNAGLAGEHDVFRMEIWAHVDRILKPNEALVLRFVYILDKRLEDVATILGMRLHTVASIHRRALRKLERTWRREKMSWLQAASNPCA